MLGLFPWSMYFLSFVPLWCAVIFVDFCSLVQGTRNNKTEIISIVCIIIGMITSMVVLCKCLKRAQNEEQQSYIIEKATEQKSIIADFLLAYTLPLLAFDFTQWDQVVLFLIFFATLAYISIRHNYIILNLVLDFMGYRFYECVYRNTDGIEISRIVISRQRLNAKTGLAMRVFPLNDDYAIDQFRK